MESTKLHEYCFISKKEYDILLNTVCESVNCFYNEIASVICSYLHLRGKLGQLLDVYDERGSWRVACIVALNDEYVGIHFNACGCRWDDWIHYKSARLAPLHRHSRPSYLDYLVVFEDFQWCKAIYTQFLSSACNGYRDRLNLYNLWIRIVQCKETSKEEQFVERSEVLTVLQSYNEALHPMSHSFLLNYRNHPSDYYPEAMQFNRSILEENAQLR